jgi:hypothetical protein
MNTAKENARIRNVSTTRRFLERNYRRYFSEQVLSESQAPTPVGSQYIQGTMLFSIGRLSQAAREWVQKYDKYRIREVEINVYSNAKLESVNTPMESVPITLYAYEDQDADPDTQTSWVRVSDRQNLACMTLNSAYPRHHVVRFNPTPSMAANTVLQNPANIIPGKNAWLDALAIDQEHAGIRFFAICPTTDNTGKSYRYELNFEVRYTVEVQQPL